MFYPTVFSIEKDRPWKDRNNEKLNYRLHEISNLNHWFHDALLHRLADNSALLNWSAVLAADTFLEHWVEKDGLLFSRVFLHKRNVNT